MGSFAGLLVQAHLDALSAVLSQIQCCISDGSTLCRSTQCLAIQTVYRARLSVTSASLFRYATYTRSQNGSSLVGWIEAQDGAPLNFRATELAHNVQGLLGWINSVGWRFDLSRANESDQVAQLLEAARLHRTDALVALLGAPAELGEQSIGHLFYHEYDASFAQALQAAVQTARRRPEIYDDVHVAAARIHRALDQLALVQVLVPLNHVDSEIGE